MSIIKTFRAAFFFCGSGVGAKGAIEAIARLGSDRAKFVCTGGIDNDAEACADFEYLTGTKATCADMAKMTPAEVRAACGQECPDWIFTSPPCKGFSGLLSNANAEKAKYQALNQLVLQGLFLMVESWAPRVPSVIVLENVPRIQSRGKRLLEKARQLLSQYGYVFDEATHDCGEVGGLAQHRKRYLLIARQPKQVPAYIYRPPKQRVKGCGEVLEALPLPEDESAGELHRLPKISWLNWVRLALIPAGGDWRDLPGMAPADPEARRAWEQRGEKREGAGPHWYKGKYGVGDWSKPSRAVIGGPSNGANNVADPRIALAATADGAGGFKGRPGLMGVLDWNEPSPAVIGHASVSGGHAKAAVADPRVNALGLPSCQPNRHHNKYTITPWDEPAKTVIAATRPGSGALGVADPRGADLALHNADPSRGGALGVIPWAEPAPTITGNLAVSGSNTPGSVADPRGAELAVNARPNRYTNQLRVREWDKPAGCVTGDTDIQEGAQIVADPRPARDYRNGTLGVVGWSDPAKTVTGESWPMNGTNSVADPRVQEALPLVQLGCRPRGNTRGPYGVISWQEAAATITGHARIDNGAFAVADPRKPPEGGIPVIIAADGTWHRPLTTLELAVLQGLPPVIDGKPLKLAGKKVSAWRERIGNAVPRHAATAIAETILTALLAASLGTWTLGSTGIWVRNDGRTEDELNAEIAA